jgi:glutamate-1-semialdehyde 2,1-aminomutase
MTDNHSLFNAAQQHIPGGVNSPVRAFKGVGGDPIFFKQAKGAYLIDASGKQYIDYVASWGPAILGHAHPEVIKVVQQQAELGLSFGAPTEIETQMADKICELIPSMEMIRMVSSGTEATMAAIRLARGYTGRDKIVKFEGCYHGHSDSLLVKAGSGALTLGVPSSPGIPKELAELTITLTHNDAEEVRQVFAEIGKEIACIIVEPIAGNMNCIPPEEGFLETLRQVCDDNGTVLIFDEVMCGFRAGLTGAQGKYNITPDLTTFGKVIGGGMPVGSFGGKKEIMQHIAPLGPVYQAGTLSGNPIAMAAGLKTLELISQPGFFAALEAKATKLLTGLQAAADEANIPFTTNQVGAMFGFFFNKNKNISRFAQVTEGNMEHFQKFYHGMLAEGIYLAPSAYEAGFMSLAHTEQDIENTVLAAKKVMKTL